MANNIQEHREEQNKKLAKSFVTYKDISLVNTSVDPKVNQEKFVTLPFTGTGVVGKHTTKIERSDDFLSIIVRDTVFKKLKKVDEALKNKNPAWQLVVVYGYRTPQTQQDEFDKEEERLKAIYDAKGKSFEFDREEFNEEVHRKVAVPMIAGHPTGGAVDVTIYDFVEQRYLDFGTEVCDFFCDDCFYKAPRFRDTDISKNRQILREVMRKQNFAPYDGEWWHFSYGDKEWVVYNRKQGQIIPRHLYDAVNPDQIVYADKNKYVETFETDEHLVLAVQKDGRLTEETVGVLNKAGINISIDKQKLFTKSSSFSLEILLVRDDDIPQLVACGIADIGIVGENVYSEKKYEAEERNEVFGCSINKYLGFGRCSLWIAVPEASGIKKVEQLANKKVATSYPLTAKKFFNELKISGVEVKKFFGSVEITPTIGFADAIIDIVSTGNSLRQNKLKELQKISDSESVLIQKADLKGEKEKLLREFLMRFQSGVDAKKYTQITINANIKKAEKIKDILLDEDAKLLIESVNQDTITLQAVVLKSKLWEKIIMKIDKIIGKGYKEISFSDISGMICSEAPEKSKGNI